jgi:hypothetical protein
MVEPYKVGISLALSSNHEQVFAALAKGLLGVNTNINQLHGNFAKLGKIIGGSFAMITGGVILRGLESIILKTADLSQELARIQMLGIGAQETARIRQQAGAIASRTPTMTSKDALEAYGQTYSMLGGKEAEKLMEPLTRFKSAMTAVSGKPVTPEQLREVTRAADLLGRLNDPKTGNYDEGRFKHFLDIAAKVYSSTHGQVGPHEWLMMGQLGGPAFMGQSDRGLATAAISSQMMGAYRTGTAEMSLYQQFIGGKMGRSQAEELVKLGILSPGDVRESGRGIGHHLHARYGPRGIGRSTGGSEGGRMNLLNSEGQQKLAEFLGDNPLEAAGRMRLQMEKQGITDPKAQLQEIFKAFGRNTTQRLMADIVRSFTQITGEIGRLDTSADVEGMIKIAHDTSIPYNLLELNAAWKELLYTLSDSSNSVIVGWLHSFTGTIQGLDKSLKGADPMVLKALAAGVAALGAALLGAGVGLIIAAFAAGGWVIPAFAAVIAFLGALALIMHRVPTNRESLRRHFGHPHHEPQGMPWSNPGFNPISYGTGGGSSMGSLVIDGPIGMVVFTDRALAGVGGRGGGGGITRANYTNFGESLGVPGGSSGAHFGIGGGRIPSLPSPGTNSGALTDGIGTGLGGSAFLKARRAKFGNQFASTPGLRDEVLGMMLKEGTPQASVESLLNRADMTGGSLHGMLHGGFYGPINRGELPGAIAQLHRNPKLAAQMNRALDAALGGSHIIGGYTDQGNPTDPNGRHFPQMKLGGNVFTDWGGGGGHSRSEAYRHFIEHGIAADGLHGKSLRDHFGYRGRHDPEHPSAAIPHAQSRAIHLHNTTTLDGEAIGRNTTRHLVHSFNGPAKSGRMPDFAATRPVSI